MAQTEDIFKEKSANDPTYCSICSDTGIHGEKNQGKLSTTGKVVIGVSGAIFVGVCAVTSPFLSPALRKVCLPYVPATTAQVRNVIGSLKGRKGSVLDIGSGDGRIVLETAKHGFKSSGVELNYWLVLYSRYQAWKQGQKNAAFYRKDLWKTNLSVYDNIVIFGVEQMMSQLEAKFDKELQREGQVIACRFPLPNWLPVREHGSGIDRVWVYKHPSNMEERIAKPSLDTDLHAESDSDTEVSEFINPDTKTNDQNTGFEKVTSSKNAR